MRPNSEECRIAQQRASDKLRPLGFERRGSARSAISSHQRSYERRLSGT